MISVDTDPSGDGADGDAGIHSGRGRGGRGRGGRGRGGRGGGGGRTVMSSEEAKYKVRDYLLHILFVKAGTILCNFIITECS